MFEVILFGGIICLLFFVPVNFRFFYRKVATEDVLIAEMIFLNGMIKRGMITSLLHPNNADGSKNEQEFGRWFFIKQAPKPPKVKKKAAMPEMEALNPVERIGRFGLGITLLSYFLPANYVNWLNVKETLERRGAFIKFRWVSRLGTGEPALTTFLVGFLSGVKGVITSLLSHVGAFRVAPELKVYPDFTKTSLDTVVDCIFSIKLGYIILAGLLAKLRR